MKNKFFILVLLAICSLAYGQDKRESILIDEAKKEALSQCKVKFKTPLAMTAVYLFYVEENTIGCLKNIAPEKRYYLRRYDFNKKKSSRLTEYPLHLFVDYFGEPTEKEVKPGGTTMVFLDKESSFVLAKVDFSNNNLQELAVIPFERKPLRAMTIPNSPDKIAYSYIVRGGPGALQHGLDVIDLSKNQVTTVLKRVRYQSLPFARAIDSMPFIFADERALVYVKTINNYFYDVILFYRDTGEHYRIGRYKKNNPRIQKGGLRVENTRLYFGEIDICSEKFLLNRDW